MGFRACGSNDVWWLEFAPETEGVERLKIEGADGCYAGDDVAGRTHSEYIEMNGDLSEPGRFGHMNGYRRELRVREIFYVANVGPRTCELAPSLQPRK
jgi:hypothetical protein